MSKKKKRHAAAPNGRQPAPVEAPSLEQTEPLETPDEELRDELAAALGVSPEPVLSVTPRADPYGPPNEEQDEEQDAIFAATVGRGLEHAFGVAAGIVKHLERQKQERAFELQLRVEEIERPAPPDTSLVAACIVASALDAHRETIQSLGLLPRGPLSRADRDHAAEVGEVLNVTQNALSQQNEARNRAVRDLERIAAALDGPMDPATIDDARMSLRDVLGYLRRAGAPKFEADHG